MQLNLETDRRYFLSKDIKTIIISDNDKVKAWRNFKFLG